MRYLYVKFGAWSIIRGTKPAIPSLEIFSLNEVDAAAFKADYEGINPGAFSSYQDGTTFKFLGNHPDVAVLKRIFPEVVRQFRYDVETGPDETYLMMAILPEADDPTTTTLSGDFFDALRVLDTTLGELAEYLRGINNPDLLDDRLELLKRTVNSKRCFTIGIGTEEGPKEVPKAEYRSLWVIIKEIDWYKHSEHAQKLSQTIIKILDWAFKQPN